MIVCFDSESKWTLNVGSSRWNLDKALEKFGVSLFFGSIDKDITGVGTNILV